MLLGSRKWLLLPVETVARELDAKILQASIAVQNGWGAIIGSRESIRDRQHLLPKGILLEKSISPVDRTHIIKSKKNGYNVSAWCEEGLIYFNRDDYLQRRIDLDNLRDLNYFFTWGEQQTEDVLVVDDALKNKVITTGHPRFDLLRKEFRSYYSDSIEKLQKRYGKMILINTKFAAANNGDSYKKDYTCYVEYMKATNRSKTKEHENLLHNLVTYQKQMMGYFAKLIAKIANQYPKHSIIVRPHPSEDNQFWIDMAKDISNVFIIYDGSVVDWILASEAMIHSSCTTGVEAYLLDKISISYRPIQNEQIESILANALSYQAFEEKEVLDYINSILSKNNNFTNEEYSSKRKIAKKYIGNLSISSLASEKIFEHLDQVFIENTLYKINTDLLEKKMIRHITKRFTGINNLEIESAIKKIGAYGKNINYQKVFTDCYCLWR